MNNMNPPAGSAVTMNEPCQRLPRQKFNKKGQKICSFLQIIVAFVTMLFGLTIYFSHAGGCNGLFFIGMYLWIFMVIAGDLGKRSSRTEKTRHIVGCLVMSVLSMLSGLTIFIWGVTATIADAEYKKSGTTYMYDKINSSIWRVWLPPNPDAALTVDIFGVCIGLTSMCFAIAQIVICSQTTCCAEQPPQQPQEIYRNRTAVVSQTSERNGDSTVGGYIMQPVIDEPPPPYSPPYDHNVADNLHI